MLKASKHGVDRDLSVKLTETKADLSQYYRFVIN